VFLFEIPLSALAGAVAFALLLDALIGRWRFGGVKFPLSGAIVALSACLQIYSPSSLAPYLLAAVGILSKGFVLHRGRHFFNPSNFAIVAAVLLAPNWCVGELNLFGGYWLPSAVFFVLGVIVAGRAGQLPTALSWLAGFVFFNWYRGHAQGVLHWPLFLQVMNPSLILYTFHMITDPATTPRTASWKVAFGLATALVDAALRFQSVIYSNFYALFLVSCFTPFVWDWETRGSPAAWLRAGLARLQGRAPRLRRAE
jgi:enediyne biosynthesis protein E5